MKLPLTHALAALVLALSFAAPVAAGPIEDALAAMKVGRKEDYATALQLLRPLAEQGDPRAEYYLGKLYYVGGGVTESNVEAVNWYRKAAEQGFAMAQYDLGYAYEKGVGVLREVVNAHMWLNLAAAGGQRDAADERDELEKRMTPAQIAEAEKLAREWKPTKQLSR
jgi:TPR repeat protein